VGEQWVEAEAMLPDGRRVFARSTFKVSASTKTPSNAFLSNELEKSRETVALFHLNDSLNDETSRGATLQLSGHPGFDNSNLSWMKERTGAALRFKDLGDKATTTVDLGDIAGGISELTVQAKVYINSFKAYNKGNAKILSLAEDWNSKIEFIENIYEGAMIKGGTQFSIDKKSLTNALSLTNWHHLALSVSTNGYSFRVDGKVIATQESNEIQNWGRKPATLEIGNVDGYIDEVAVLVKSN
jgi:hypothetical protein